MPRIALLLLLLCLPAPAQEDGLKKPPLIFFRTPDPKTRKEIRAEIKNLNDSTIVDRRRARRRLADIGIWSVPALSATLEGKKREKDMRVRMNAILTLSQLEDPRSLPSLRAAAHDSDSWVRRSAMLVLGHFRQGADRDLLLEAMREMRSNRKHQAAAALAAAKLPRTGDDLLGIALFPLMKRDDANMAGMLLAAIVATPDSPEPRRAKLQKLLEKRLEEDSKLVRRVAATGLIARPGLPGILPRLQRRIRRERDKHVRALLYGAIAALPRTDAIRVVLLKTATDANEKREVRAAAALGLADEWPPSDFWNDDDRYKKLRFAARKGGNNDLTAALMFALAHTGRPEAVDELLRFFRQGNKYAKIYSAGCLGHLIAFPAAGKFDSERAEEIRLTLVHSQVTDPRLKRVRAAVQQLFWERRDPGMVFGRLGDIDPYGMWSRSERERALDLVNARVYEVLELDYVADAGDRERTTKQDDDGDDSDSGDEEEDDGDGSTAPKIPGKGTGTTSRSAEENDLIDFLRHRPYYEEHDLGR
ncbi:MAG: HEAT repeat domain-containing protein [Planctomycetota bacterium]